MINVKKIKCHEEGANLGRWSGKASTRSHVKSWAKTFHRGKCRWRLANF